MRSTRSRRYSTASKLGDYAWYSESSGLRKHPVATKKANVHGLFDLHGNVREWCLDEYKVRSPDDPLVPLPTGSPTPTAQRVLRGGDWSDSALRCRAAARTALAADLHLGTVGFRLCLPDETEAARP